jgi:hypothetical protein
LTTKGNSHIDGRLWPTARAYAATMGLPYPIPMRHPQVDLKPGKHWMDSYILAMVNILGKDKAAQVLGINMLRDKGEHTYGDNPPIIDEAAYYEETGKLFPPGVTTREEAERLEKEKP